MAAKSGRAILRIGYTDFIMDAKVATELFTSLASGNVEIYEEKWVNNAKGSEPRVTQAGVDLVTLRVLSEDKYAMGKLLQAADDKAQEK
jgi:hypothetical protein